MNRGSLEDMARALALDRDETRQTSGAGHGAPPVDIRGELPGLGGAQRDWKVVKG